MSPVEERVTRVLGAWAVASVATGAGLASRSASRGFGRQTAAWGLVDGVIVAAGLLGRKRRGPTDPVRLRRILLVNAGLDVGYVATGVGLVRHGRWRGDGWAVVVQGAFLLILDAAAARALARPGAVLPREPARRTLPGKRTDRTEGEAHR